MSGRRRQLGRLQDAAYGHFGPFATGLTAVKIDPAFRAFGSGKKACDPASAATLRARHNGRAWGHARCHGCRGPNRHWWVAQIIDYRAGL